ncbi:expressed unknown protein [Seminavis robusta]|uniref:Uncharacterized protein n=1 Tax=Seminavis robusta TaxID=568900 RepID=A0A9N8E6K4_9STRA|nr:expressed unknown protein [Seminavis robusta]|eukprot:Sro717_g192060.1 n/a (353) ;mRNA; r:38273-39481
MVDKDEASVSIDSDLYLDINNHLDFVIKVGLNESVHPPSSTLSTPAFRRFRLRQLLDSSGNIALVQLAKLVEPVDYETAVFFYRDNHGDKIVVKSTTELLDAISQFQDRNILVLHSFVKLRRHQNCLTKSELFLSGLKSKPKLLAISRATWEGNKSDFSFQHLVNGRPEWSKYVAMRGIYLDLSKEVEDGRFRLLLPRKIYQDFRTKLKETSRKADLDSDLTSQKLQLVYGYTSKDSPPVLVSLADEYLQGSAVTAHRDLFEFARSKENCDLYPMDALLTMAAQRHADGAESCQLTLLEVCIQPAAAEVGFTSGDRTRADADSQLHFPLVWVILTSALLVLVMQAAMDYVKN